MIKRRDFLLGSLGGLVCLVNSNSRKTYAETKSNENPELRNQIEELTKKIELPFNYKTEDGYFNSTITEGRIKISLSNQRGGFFNRAKYTLELIDEYGNGYNPLGTIDRLKFFFSSKNDKKDVNGKTSGIKTSKEMDFLDGELKKDAHNIYFDSIQFMLSDEKYVPYDFLKKIDTFCQKYLLEDKNLWPLKE